MVKLTLQFSIAVAVVLLAPFAALASTPQHFGTTGKIANFEYAPPLHPVGHVYDVLYYIPKTVASSTTPMKAVVFLHGGGQSTESRDGSFRVAKDYIEWLRPIADQLGFVMIHPSGTGLNWGYHGHGYIRNLVALARSELNLDADRIVLAGHSMGGMGITREFPYLIDQFAAMIPMAAGMDPVLQVEDRLNKLFNVPYTHLQGLYNHFDVFVERCRIQEKNMADLEKKYGQKSQFKMVYYNGDHNPDLNLYTENLKKAFEQTPRNLLQKDLRGSLMIEEGTATEHNIPFHVAPVDRYFWVQAIDYDVKQPGWLNFRAIASGNTITVTTEKTAAGVKKLRVYLADGLVDMKLPVEVLLNGKSTKYTPSKRDLAAIQAATGEKVYTDFVDVEI